MAWNMNVNQHNVTQSRSNTQASQTLSERSPVLISNSKCSRAPLELCKLLSDSARAFASATGRTCSDGGAIRMLRDLIIMIVILWSCYDLSEDLRNSSRAPEISVHPWQETWCRIPTVVVPWVPQLPGILFIRLVFVRHKIRHNMKWHVLSKSLYIYTYQNTALTEKESAIGSIYLVDPRMHWHHRTIQNSHSIFHSSLSHALLPIIDRFTELVWVIVAGYSFISSHPLSIHLEPTQLLLKSSLQMHCKAQRSEDDALPAIALSHFTTLWSRELGYVVRGC
jgi:hypothetical protein